MATFVVLAALLASAPAGADNAIFPPSDDNFLRLMAITNGGNRADQIYSQQEAVALARRHDVIIALKGTFRPHLPAMKAANPNLQVLVYMNGAFAQAADRKWMPEAWFLHDSEGNRIHNLNFDLTYMDVGHPDWRSFVADRCANWGNRADYDGCYLDDLGVGNLGTNLSAWPIDPRTGVELTEAAFISYAKGLLNDVATANPEFTLTSNGLNHGDRYFDPTVRPGRLLDVADAAQAEGWLRGNTKKATSFRDEASWKRDVDMLVHAAARNKTVFAATKLWAPATAAQIEQWRGYTYASFLLATDGTQLLHFDHTGPGRSSPAHPWDDIDLGRPTDNYSKRDGIYQRNFTLGRVLVNPTGRSVILELPAAFVTQEGHTVTRVAMAPHTGLLLRKTNAPLPLCRGEEATLVGTGDNDVLRGTRRRDIIVALGGDDVIAARAGDDVICGGDGDDVVYGGAGNDYVLSGEGDDRVTAGTGRDKILGEGGQDVIAGRSGRDKLIGGHGNDTCKGGAGADLFSTCERIRQG